MAKEISKVTIEAPAFEIGRKLQQTAVRVTVSAAQILALFATPFSVVPAPGAGKALVFKGMYYEFTHGTAYLLGEAITPVYHGATTDLSGAGGIAASVLTTATSVNGWVPSISVVAVTANVGIDLYIPTQAFTTGNGTFVLEIQYDVITLG